MPLFVDLCGPTDLFLSLKCDLLMRGDFPLNTFKGSSEQAVVGTRRFILTSSESRLKRGGSFSQENK